MEINHALGIDFGTSNSYFSDISVGGSQPTCTDIKINGMASIPTCLLFRHGNNREKKVVAFGQQPFRNGCN